MSLIKCPECENEISDKSKICIHCGYPIFEANKKRLFIEKINSVFFNRFYKVIVIVGLLLAIGVFFRFDIMGLIGIHTIQITKIEEKFNLDIGDELEFKMNVVGNIFNKGEVYYLNVDDIKDFALPVEFIVVEKDKINDIGIESVSVTENDIGHTRKVTVRIQERGGTRDGVAVYDIYYKIR